MGVMTSDYCSGSAPSDEASGEDLYKVNTTDLQEELLKYRVDAKLFVSFS